VNLTRVDIQSFRGYSAPCSFDCLADVIILHGPNGSGKTSFFDAIAWGLFGDIRRLRGSRDFVGDTHIGSYFSPDDEPRVSIHLVDGDRTALLVRGRSSLLVVEAGVELEGDAAEGWIADQFRPAGGAEEWTVKDAERRFLSAHLLGQEEVATFLRGTNPRDRFDSLASLLGVDLVRSFYSHVDQSQKNE
jgi:exonuclease SbcC